MGKILMWNFIGLIGAMVLTGLMGGGDSVVADMLIILLQAAANFLLGLIFVFGSKKPAGVAFLLSAVLVFIIGFGMCAGKAELLNFNLNIH